MLINILLLVVSLALLVVGAELLVRGSVSLARRLGLSNLFIGLTIVGFGTSAPEAGASVLAAARGLDGIAVGNVIGSNICNVALILGASALVRPLVVNVPMVRREILIATAVSAVPLAALATGGRIGRAMGVAMLLGLVLVIWFGWRRAREQTAEERRAETQLETDVSGPVPEAPLRATLRVLAGLVVLVFGARILVGSAVDLASVLGVPELIVGLTIVAAGTSAPELATSLIAARRGQSDLAVGNIVGSNLFNILGILGASAVVSPQSIGGQVVRLDLPLSILLMAVLIPMTRTGSRISRVEGAVLFSVYVLYVVFLYALAPRLFPA